MNSDTNFIQPLISIFNKYRDDILNLFNFFKDVSNFIELDIEDSLEDLPISDLVKKDEEKGDFIDLLKHLVSLIDNFIEKNENKTQIGSKTKFSKKSGELFSELIMQISRIFNKKRYKKWFYNMVHIYLICQFEAFNKDFFTEVFCFKPEKLKSKHLVSYQEIIDFSKMEDLNRYLAYKKMNDIFYSDIDDFAEKFLKKFFQIEITEKFKEWNDLRESYYRRNIIVHNGGKISDTYIKKMKCIIDDSG